MTAATGRLVRLDDLDDPVPALEALEAIFFESSSRTHFANESDRQRFFRRWTAYYLTQCRADLWLSQDGSGQFSGYLTGCRDSAAAAPLYDEVPGYALFESNFGRFPAHLHVNCRADRRGQGIGAALVAAFVADCQAAGLTGVHLVTAPDARNVGFYHRLGFTVQELRPFGNRSLLFLGRPLEPEASQ